MKKPGYKRYTTLIAAILLLMCTDMNGQSNWEIGGRFGNTWGLDITIPFAAPRLHPAVYFGNDVVVGAYFDWLFDLEGDPYGLKFYPGVGPELHFGNNLDIAAAGNFGVEYSFGFPLTIAFDWRPRFMLTDQFDFNGKNWGISARLRIGKGVRFVRSN